MKNKSRTTPVTLAIGAAFTAGIATSPVVQADLNPFAVTALSSGYMVSADKGSEGQCGAAKIVNEAKCGAEQAAKKVAKEGKCGTAKTVKEGECGANKASQTKPVKEAKCGEAKCGANK